MFFKSLEELLNSSKKPPRPFQNVYIRSKRKNTRGPELLVCHDMKGGYLDFEIPLQMKGEVFSDFFGFLDWEFVDTFVYFSHHRVSVPPLGWILSAKRHGSSILGSLTTEGWQAGGQEDTERLGREANLIVPRLVDLTEYHGFDGWFINIESKFVEPQRQSQEMCNFLQLLGQQLRQRIGSHAQVIWYDSVLETGELKWQNALNPKNKIFFDASDGIFLNYQYTQDHLKTSLANAGNRKERVFVGIDLFGRNTFGGGGFDTFKALDLISSMQLSAAIFAPGWTVESADPSSRYHAQLRQAKLWQGLQFEFSSSNQLNQLNQLNQFHIIPVPPHHGVAQHWPSHPTVRQLPFCSSFCSGSGQNLFQQGRLLSESAWDSLSLLDLPSGNLTLSSHLVFEKAFNGGSCLRVDEEKETIELLNADIACNQEILIEWIVSPNLKDAVLLLNSSIKISACVVRKVDENWISCSFGVANVRHLSKVELLMPKKVTFPCFIGQINLREPSVSMDIGVTLNIVDRHSGLLSWCVQPKDENHLLYCDIYGVASGQYSPRWIGRSFVAEFQAQDLSEFSRLYLRPVDLFHHPKKFSEFVIK